MRRPAHHGRAAAVFQRHELRDESGHVVGRVLAVEQYPVEAGHAQAVTPDGPSRAAFRRFAGQPDVARTTADAAREQRRMQGLWSYSRVPAGKGTQVSASIYARDGVRIDGQKVSDKGLTLAAGTYVLQVGKRKFARVHLSA